MSDGRDSCALCAGDCVCESASLSDEQLRERQRARERLRELYREAGRPLPAWVLRL